MKFSLNRTNSQNKANSENTVTLYKIIVFSYPYGAYYHSDILELLRWNPHFTPLRPKRWPIWTMLSDASKPSFLASLSLVTVRVTFWSCYSKILTEPHYNPKDSQFKKYCHTPLNHRFQLVIMGLSSERHFGDLTMKSSLNSITTQIGEIFKQPHYDSKDGQICKMLLEASKSLLSADLRVLNFRAIFWSIHGEVLT